MNNHNVPKAMPADSARSVLIGIVSLILALGGLAYSLGSKGAHPALLSFCFLWLVTPFVAGTSREKLLAMPNEKFRLARWELNGRFYECCGVRQWRKLVLCTALGWLDTRVRLEAGPAGLDHLEGEMRYAEGTHQASALVGLVAAIIAFWLGHVAVAIWLTALNLPMNLYPVMLQRWIRSRIERMRSQFRGVGYASGRNIVRSTFAL
jgi:hypothetical protein